MSQQVLKPRVRGFICITSHPDGCAAAVREQIGYVKSRQPIKDGPINTPAIISLTTRDCPIFMNTQAVARQTARMNAICRKNMTDSSNGVIGNQLDMWMNKGSASSLHRHRRRFAVLGDELVVRRHQLDHAVHDLFHVVDHLLNQLF